MSSLGRATRAAGQARQSTPLVVIAVDLLVEGLGIKGSGRAGDAGDQQQSNKSGRDGVHGYLSSGLIGELVSTNEFSNLRRLARATFPYFGSLGCYLGHSPCRQPLRPSPNNELSLLFAGAGGCVIRANKF